MLSKRLAVLAVLAAALLGVAAGAGLLLVLRAVLRPAPAALLNSATVVQRIQTLSTLVTVKYVLEKVVVYDDPKYLGGLIPLGENRLILLAHGEVLAGVDFSQLSSQAVTISGRRIVLTIPPAVVTDAHLVEQHTHVLDWHTGMLRSFDKQLEQSARRQAVVDITRAARQSGIEEEAATRARTQLTAFLKALGFDEVRVQTQSK
jgi:hypothetical protein